MKGEVNLTYLHQSDVSQEAYLLFLRQYYKDRAEYRLYKRYRWYNSYMGFHCLLAIVDNIIVGQSCAFKVRMMTPEGEIEWWWGCDSFVLESARGKGIGKLMQKKLFEDHPNFSSIGYSNTNGHIKKLMGANTIGLTYPALYSVRRYFSILFQLFYMKAVGKRQMSNMFFPSSSLYEKYIMGNRKSDIIAKETCFTDENINFIDNVLKSQYNYFIIRDKEYLTWKYETNPSVEYHLVEIRKNDILLAVILFSPVYEGEYLGCPIKLCKLYDYFIKVKTEIKRKDIISIIVNFFSERNQKIDGIYSNQKLDYPFTIKYPYAGKEFLSGYNRHLDNSYISLSDQDLDQLRYLEVF